MDAFAAYIPMDRRQAMGRGETLPNRLTGAVLFADISGFTPLTHAFAKALGAKRGAEALLGHVNRVYEALIGALHRCRGSVIGFAGDGIICWFDDSLPDATARAVACGLAMQAVMAPFSAVPVPGSTAVDLAIKVAIASGSVRRFLVGDPSILLFDFLAGAILERIRWAEGHTERGEVVVSREVVAQLGEELVVAAWHQGDEVEHRFAVVGNLNRPVPPEPWLDAGADGVGGSLRSDQSRSWLLSPIYEQLCSGVDVVGDLRPVTPLFLQFGGIDFEGEDGAGERLDRFVRWAQRVIDRYGGHIIQLTAGDKGTFLYAVFGAPVAHEDDNRRALVAALSLGSPPAELSFIGPMRVGISRGEVWTGVYGAAARHTYGVIGNEVNLAARLMAKARPGEILVSGRVGRQLGFNFAFLDDVVYKGFDTPIPTYRLLGEETAEQRAFAGQMVGRQAELARLIDFARPLLAGQFAGLAIIYGEPGIGKSRLSYALHQALGQQVTWYIGQTDPIFRQAFNPFVYWLKGYFHQSSEASSQENKARFERQYARLLRALSRQPDSAELEEELIRTRSILGALLGLSWPGSLYEELDAKLRYENSLYALATLLLAESRLHPLVFELEDAQWLDAASQEFLAVLGRTAKAHPLLLLVTARYADDGSRPDFGIEDVPELRLDLDVLDGEELQALAQARLGAPPSPSLLEHLTEKTGGNPFFVEQTLLDLKERAALTFGEEGWAILPDRLGELPETINALLIARIDRLSTPVQEAVKAAAVLGREFEVRVLSEMLKGEGLEAPLSDLVREAERQEIWVRL